MSDWAAILLVFAVLLSGPSMSQVAKAINRVAAALERIADKMRTP